MFKEKTIIINPIYAYNIECLFLSDRSCSWRNRRYELRIGTSSHRCLIYINEANNMQGLRICLKKIRYLR
jgi:hypothetical protein